MMTVEGQRLSPVGSQSVRSRLVRFRLATVRSPVRPQTSEPRVTGTATAPVNRTAATMPVSGTPLAATRLVGRAGAATTSPEKAAMVKRHEIRTATVNPHATRIGTTTMKVGAGADAGVATVIGRTVAAVGRAARVWIDSRASRLSPRTTCWCRRAASWTYWRITPLSARTATCRVRTTRTCPCRW
jgi:hypothetical protein